MRAREHQVGGIAEFALDDGRMRHDLRAERRGAEQPKAEQPFDVLRFIDEELRSRSEHVFDERVHPGMGEDRDVPSAALRRDSSTYSRE